MEEVRRNPDRPLWRGCGARAEQRLCRRASGCAPPTIRACSARPRPRFATASPATSAAAAGATRASASTSTATGAAASPSPRSASATIRGGRRSCSRRRAAASPWASPTAAPGRCPPRSASMPRRGGGGSAFDALRPGAIDRGRARGRGLGAALDPRSLGRDGRRGGGDGPHPRHAGRLRRARRRFQPRHPGAAPARLDLQADRLCRRARQRHDPGLDHHRRPVLRQSGHAEPEMLPQFRRQRRRRPADDALGPRAIAQPDDRAHRQPGRHGHG